MPMMNWGNHGIGWGMGFGWFFMLLFWVLVVLGIAYIIRMISERSGTGPKREESALDILENRYAKGEISKEQFESMKSDLTKNR